MDKKFSGQYKLIHPSPDNLPDKDLRIFPDGTFVLLEFEGNAGKTEEIFYHGNCLISENKIEFTINKHANRSSFLVYDGTADDDQKTFEKNSWEIISGEISSYDPITINVVRGKYLFTYKRMWNL